MKSYNIDEIKKYIQNTKFCIEKHPNSDLYIIGYDTRKEGIPISWNNYNIQFRGLIIDKNGNICSRPIPKFFTFKEYITKDRILLSEGETIKLPNEPFRIFEKVDGSLSILYWIDNTPFLATQRSFTSPNAIKANQIFHSKYSHLFKTLDKNCTYIFEAIYPNTRVMVNYNETEDLILLARIDNPTGKDLSIEGLGFKTAEEFTDKYKKIKNLSELSNLNLPNLEGFVLVYENGFRIKIKFDWFNKAHGVVNKLISLNKLQYEYQNKLKNLLNIKLKTLSNKDVYNSLKNNSLYEDILINVPEEFYIHGFDFWLNELIENFNKYNSDNNASIEWVDFMKAIPIEYFEINERFNYPKYSTPMWNFIDRVKNKYI